MKKIIFTLLLFISSLFSSTFDLPWRDYTYTNVQDFSIIRYSDTVKISFLWDDSTKGLEGIYTEDILTSNNFVYIDTNYSDDNILPIIINYMIDNNLEYIDYKSFSDISFKKETKTENYQSFIQNFLTWSNALASNLLLLKIKQNDN